MLAFTYVYKCYQKSVLWNMNDIQFNEVSLSRNSSTILLIGMGPSTCSLDARSVLGVFDGARARVLESEHMLVLARARG